MATIKLKATIVEPQEAPPIGNVVTKITVPNGIADQWTDISGSHNSPEYKSITRSDLLDSAHTPLMPYILENYQLLKVEFYEVGYVNNEHVFTPTSISNMGGLLLSADIQNVAYQDNVKNYPPLQLNQQFAFGESFPLDYRDMSRLMINFGSFPANYNHVYVKYKGYMEDDSYFIGTIVISKGSSKYQKTTYSNLGISNVDLNSMNVININNFEGFNFNKHYDSIETSDTYLNALYPEIMGDNYSFIYKIIFQDDNYIGSLGSMVKVQVDPRLTYNGVPVYYSQEIPIEGMNAGLLRYDTSGMTIQQINAKQFNLVLMGYSTGYDWK